MLTDSALRSKVDALWDKLWSGGVSNPLDAIEQRSFLFFLKRLDEREQDAERAARLRGKKHQPIFPDTKLRWSHWTQLPADQALRHVKEQVFPFIKTLGGEGGSFAQQMANAEFKINKTSLLVEATKAIDDMEISSQNQDVQGDLYEYLLSKLNTAGQNGQFRTPRHIIRMMVKLVDPQPGERVCDPAAGTCGFLVNAYQHILETHTRPDNLTYDAEGFPHHLIGDQLSAAEHKFLQTRALTGYDNDSGMTMLRIGCMNLMLHGIDSPNFRYADTLSKGFDEERLYDVVLANPPFKGAIDAADVNPSLPAKCKKTEILFLHLFVRLLENGGRAAVIVPDGVLFGSSRAHVEVRKKLIEDNRLDAVVSMPSGVFRPYAGVSTAVLVFTRGSSTDKIWFYDMEHDGFSLDDKRQKVAENDIPDLLECWKKRKDVKFQQKRAQRLADLQKQIGPLKADRMQHHATIHRLHFEEVIAHDGNAEQARRAREQAEAELAELQTRIAPLEQEMNQLGRQFWVSKDQVKAATYDLSAGRYRQVEREEVFCEEPELTLCRMRKSDTASASEMDALTSIFTQFFGNLRDMEEHKICALEDIAEIASGIAKGQRYGERETVEVPYLRVANVQDGFLDLREIETIRALPENVRTLRLKPGDVVMTEGGDFDKLGRGAIWQGQIDNCIHQNHIFRVRLDQRMVLPTFFAGFLRTAFAKDYFLRCSKQTTNLATINMTQLRATPVPTPPLPVQRQFAALVQRHAQFTAIHREALRQSEHLFQTLLHRAFTSGVRRPQPWRR